MKLCHCGKKVHSKNLCSTHYGQLWRSNNPKKYKDMKYNYYQNNRDKEIERAKKWNKENKEKAKIANKKYIEKSNYYSEKYKKDETFRLKVLLRNRLLQSIKNNQKAGSAVKDLGCSIDEFKKYLESKFLPGMTWDNQGEWHIDHIEPLSNFNLSNREEFKKACHYTNLQPLWALDNIKKGNS